MNLQTLPTLFLAAVSPLVAVSAQGSHPHMLESTLAAATFGTLISTLGLVRIQRRTRRRQIQAGEDVEPALDAGINVIIAILAGMTFGTYGADWSMGKSFLGFHVDHEPLAALILAILGHALVTEALDGAVRKAISGHFKRNGGSP